MTAIVFAGQSYALADGESVLDALLRAGHAIPHGCRAGVCQACLLQSDEAPPANAQRGLSSAQKSLNYFLSCQCQPPAPLSAQAVDQAGQRVTGVVREKTWLNQRVLRLHIEAPLSFKAGQYVTLWQSAQLARSYSLAGSPNPQNLLELHIRHYPDGAFSSWAAERLNVGDSLDIQGPLGQCVYSAPANQPLLLIGMGTGLAPLCGIVQDALAQGHSAPIHLIAAARNAADLYYLDELSALAAQHPQLGITWLAQHTNHSAPPAVRIGDVYAHVKTHFASLKGYQVYLCGAASFVTKMRKQCFLSGAGMADILVDSFVPFAATKT